MVTKKRKTTKRKTRVVYVREDDSLDRTTRFVGNMMVLGIGASLVGGMLGGMSK